MTEVVWMQCRCMTWPIVLGQHIGTCRRCGNRPDKFVDEPASGRAEPIERD